MTTIVRAVIVFTAIFVCLALTPILTVTISLPVLIIGVVVGWFINPRHEQAERALVDFFAGDFDELETEHAWDRHIQRFSRRAVRWTIVGYATLVASLCSIVIGILVFVFAEQITAKDVGLEKLQADRDNMLKEIDKLDENRTNLELELQDWEAIRAAWGRLNTPVSILSFKSDPNSYLYELNALKNDTEIRRAMAHLRMPGDLEMTDDIGEASLEAFDKMLGDEGLGKTKFAQHLNELLSHVAIATANKRLENLPDDAEQAVDQLGAYKTKYDKVSSRIQAKLKSLSENQSPAQRKSLEKRRQLKERLSTLDAEIREVRQQFDPSNLYSILPVLAVRIGIVILLIYLTQIFLAMYRYSTKLAVFYNALGDTLSVTYPRRPSEDELVKLITAFNPTETGYTAPPSPVQQLAQLLAGVRGK